MFFLIAPRREDCRQPLHMGRKNLFSPDFACGGGNGERCKQWFDIGWSREQIGDDWDLSTGRMQLPSSVGSAIPRSKGDSRRSNDLDPLFILPGPEGLVSIMHLHRHHTQRLAAHVWVKVGHGKDLFKR